GHARGPSFAALRGRHEGARACRDAAGRPRAASLTADRRKTLPLTPRQIEDPKGPQRSPRYLRADPLEDEAATDATEQPAGVAPPKFSGVWPFRRELRGAVQEIPSAGPLMDDSVLAHRLISHWKSSTRASAMIPASSSASRGGIPGCGGGVPPATNSVGF